MFASMIGFFFVFGCLSRRFERQADVYAARTMQRYSPLNVAAVPTTALGSYVGPQGADLFIAALYRVAVINNIPLEPQRPTGRGLFAPASRVMNILSDKANNYFHGSIMSRINYLRSLSEDPQRTAHFDRSMLTIYAGILLVLAISGGWALISAIA
jgi:Zn-dependent protease with chaperone function